MSWAKTCCVGLDVGRRRVMYYSRVAKRRCSEYQQAVLVHMFRVSAGIPGRTRCRSEICMTALQEQCA